MAVVLASALSAAFGSEPGAAQTPRGLVRSPPDDAVHRGDSLHEALKPADALAAFRQALDADPDSYAALWRGAREEVSLGMLAMDEDAKKEHFRQAESLARKAVKVTPDDPEGHHWLSVALGRRALLEGTRTRLELGREVRREAMTVLALDSLHAGGHHVLGRWNAEVKRLSGVSRFVAEHLMGAEELDQASWDQAVAHLEKAVSLEPRSLIHHLELARVYMDLGRTEEARTQLHEVLARPSLEPTDPLHKQEAVHLMGELGGG